MKQVFGVLLLWILGVNLGAKAQQIPDGLRLVWSDEFEEDGVPNPANWKYEQGFVRNNELQWYQADNAYCRKGLLVIEARKEDKANPMYRAGSGDWRRERARIAYSSSCLITQGLQEWPAGGYYEVRARLNVASGAWPAIWLLGTQKEWPDNGEIDMLEYYQIDGKPHILANAAWGTPRRFTPAWDSAKIPFEHFLANDPNWVSRFHVWAMDWNEDFMRIYLDGELLNEIDLKQTVNADGSNPFVGDKSFYFLLNLAVGSNGGEPDEAAFPMKYEVDYVRVYQK